MAPKKKKKPAANPARGFATTSLPSKSKTAAQPGDACIVNTNHLQNADSGISLPVSVRDKNAAARAGEQSVQGPEIQDMAPEEFEAHLENSELESFLAKYAARAMVDARRQVLRLETERRQLRLQAQKLSTYSWLPDETVQELLDMSIEDKDASSLMNAAHATTVDEEKLSLDLWTLERVLLSLKFPRISEVLTHVLGLALLGQLSPVVDNLTALPEALQWYASNAQPHELSNYEQSAATERKQSADKSHSQPTSGE